MKWIPTEAMAHGARGSHLADATADNTRGDRAPRPIQRQGADGSGKGDAGWLGGNGCSINRQTIDSHELAAIRSGGVEVVATRSGHSDGGEWLDRQVNDGDDGSEAPLLAGRGETRGEKERRRLAFPRAQASAEETALETAIRRQRRRRWRRRVRGRGARGERRPEERWRRLLAATRQQRCRRLGGRSKSSHSGSSTLEKYFSTTSSCTSSNLGGIHCN